MDGDYALFLQIAEQPSLSAAGRAFGLSPAMVSKRLARLEERLGATLVFRTTRRLELSGEGLSFYRDLLAIRELTRAAEDRVVNRAGEPRGTLRISAPTSFGRLHIAPRLGEFLDTYPKVALEFDLSDGFVDLARDRIDVAVRIAARIEPELVGHRLGSSERVLCAAPAYVGRVGAPESVEGLREHRLLAASGQLPWLLEGPDGDVAIEGTSAVRTNSSEVVRELALAGQGIALRSLWDVHAQLAAGQLVRVLPEVRGSDKVGIFAVHPRAEHVPVAVAAFVGFLRGLDLPAAWAE